MNPPSSSSKRSADRPLPKRAIHGTLLGTSMSTPVKQHSAVLGPKLAFFLSLALALAYWTRYFTGYFGDDAAFLLTAKSLLQGAFRATYLVHEPAETFYLPGFPLI